MYKLGPLETNGQSQDGPACNNRDVFAGHNVNNSSCNLSSPPSESTPKSSTTSVLRRWRRPESFDSKNVQSKELPTTQPSTDKQMNPGGTYPSGDPATSGGDFSLYVPQLSPLVPQSTARPYDSKYVPQYADNKDKTQNYYPENTNQEVHFRSPTYPVQNTPPLAHTSSQKYAYPNREYSVVAHNYSPQKSNPLESKISAQEEANYELTKTGYGNRVSPQNIPQTYPIQNSIDRRVSPHNPKSPIYRTYPQNVQQNFVPTTKSSEIQNNYYLDKSPCSQKQVIDARYQNYNQNYVKNTPQDPKLTREYRNSKKSSPPFPILEQRLNQSETSYCEYPGSAYYPQKYGPVMFSRSPTPKSVGSAYPNIHHNPKMPPQEMMLPQTYPFTNKYYPQNQAQDWKMLPKEYEQNLYLSQMNQMHARLPHPKTDLPRDLSYVEQNQRLVQKSRMYCPDPSSAEHLQYPGKSIVPVTQKSPKIVGYNTENDYLNLSRSCATVGKQDFQRSSKLDYSPVIQSVKSAELSRDYLMHQQSCNEQQNYVCSPPLIGQNRNHPAYSVGFRQPKINEIPPRNISPRRTFQENMPVVVYSPQHIGIPKSSPTQLYPSEYSNPQYYPGYYPRDAYPVKTGMSQYPVDQSRKYPNVHFNGNMTQQRFHFGYPEQYYQHKIPENAEKLNYFQGNMYRGHYNPNIHELQQNAARNFEGDYRNLASNYTEFEARSDERPGYSKKDSDIGKSLKEFLESWEDDEEIVANLPDLVLCNNIPPEKQKLPFGHSEEIKETSKSSLEEEAPKETNNALNTEQPLYILDSTNISSDALPQYLAVYEQVDRLPDNIKGFYKAPTTNGIEESPVIENVEKTKHIETPKESNTTKRSISPHDLTINKNRDENKSNEEEVLNLSTNRNKENNEFLVEEYSNHSETSITETTTENKIEEKGDQKEHKQISENTRKKIEMIKQVLEEIKKNESSDTEEKCIHIIPIRKLTKKKNKDEKTDETNETTKKECKILATTSVIVPNTFFDTNKIESDILNTETTKKDNGITPAENISETEMNNNNDVFEQLESNKICEETPTKPKENIDTNLTLDVIDFETTDLIPRANFKEEPKKIIDNIIEPMSFENLINSPENIEMKDDDSIADEFEKLANHDTIIENKTDALPENDEIIVENIEEIVNSTNIEEIVTNTEESDADIPENLKEIEDKPENGVSKVIENISESVIPEKHIELLSTIEETENLKEIEQEVENDEPKLIENISESVIPEEHIELLSTIEETENLKEMEQEVENDEPKLIENISESVIPEEHIELLSTIGETENLKEIEQEVEINEPKLIENISESVILEEHIELLSKIEETENLKEIEQEVEINEPKLIENISESVIPEEHIELLSKIEETENLQEIEQEVENIEPKLIENIPESVIPGEHIELLIKTEEMGTEALDSTNKTHIEDKIEEEIEDTQVSENKSIEFPEKEVDEKPITPENKIEESEENNIPVEEEIVPSPIIDNEEENSKNEEIVSNIEKEDTFSNLSPISNYIMKEESLEIESSPIQYSNELEDIETEETNIETPENYTEEIVENTSELVLKEAKEEVIEEMEQVSEEINELEVFSSEEIIQSEVYFESTVDKLVISNVETIQDDSNDSEIDDKEESDQKIEEKSEEIKNIEESQEYAHLVGIEDHEDKSLTEKTSNPENSGVKNTKTDNNFDFSYLESCTENICEKPKTTTDVTEINLEISENQETCNSLKSILDSSESESDGKEHENCDKLNFDNDIQNETEINSDENEIITEETVETETVTELISEISVDESESITNIQQESEIEEVNLNDEQTEEKQEKFEPNFLPENKSCSSDFDNKSPKKLPAPEIDNTTFESIEEKPENQLQSFAEDTESENQVNCEIQTLETEILVKSTENSAEINTEIDSIENEQNLEENISDSVIVSEDISSEENIILPENSECVVIYGEDEQYLIIQNEENTSEMITPETEMIISEVPEPVNEEILVEDIAIDPLSEDVIICEEGIEDWVQNEEIVASDGEVETEKITAQIQEEKTNDKVKVFEEKKNKRKSKEIVKNKQKVEIKRKKRNKRLSSEERKILVTKRKKLLGAKNYDEDIKKIIETFINEEKKYSSSGNENNCEKETNSVEEKELFMNPENPVSLSDNPYPFPDSTSVIKRRVSYEEFASPKIDFKAPKRRYSSMDSSRSAKKPIINLDEISKNITEVLENLTKQEKNYVNEKTEQKIESVDTLEIKKDVLETIEEEVSEINVNNFDISPLENEEIVETTTKLDVSSSSDIIIDSTDTSNVSKLVEQLIKPKLIIPKSNIDFIVNNTAENRPSPEPLLVPKRRSSLLKTPEITEDSSPILNTARLTEPIFPKSVISEPKVTKRPNVDPRIDRSKDEKEEKPSVIENKLSNTFSLTEYTKNYIKMKTGQTVDLKNITGINGSKRIDPRMTKEDCKVEHKKKEKCDKKVKINLQDYRKRKQSQSNETLISPQINGVRKQEEETKNKNKAERKLYQNDSKSKDIPDRKVEKLILKPKKSLEQSKDVSLSEVIKSNSTNNLDCNNLETNLKCKDLQQIKPKKRKRRFRNLYTMDEEEDVPTKQPKNSLEPNGLHNEDSTCSKMSEDSQSTANSSKNEEEMSNGDLVCCLDLNSNGTSETNCAYKCHIKIDSEDKSIRDYEINTNSCSNSNKLKLTLKPVKKKKPAFSEVLSNLDSLAASEIRSKRPRKKSSVRGASWTTKKVPKVIIKRKGNGYCAVYRDVSSNPIWQPKIRLKRHKYIESLVLRSNS